MSSSPASKALRAHLEDLRSLRGRDAAQGAPPRLAELKRWQSRRLATTYRDLASDARYRLATSFFLDDLYCPKDVSARDEAMLRIFPAMTRLLPEGALETAALAIEVDLLSEQLDHRVALLLPAGELDDARYGVAYRAAGTPAERERQIRLVEGVGQRLDALVRKPFLFRTLQLMRKPATAAGLGELQAFLERGFEAFRAMGGAKEFLATVGGRERRIASGLFCGQPEAFSAAAKS